MSSAAFLRILYQNETLFRAENPIREERGAGREKADAESQPADNAPEKPVMETLKTPALPAAPAVAPPAAAAPVTASIPALREVVILADEAEHQELLASEALFLDNILKAVGHSIDDATILNLSFLPDWDARKALADKKTHFFLSFGVPLIKIHLDLLLAPYTPKLIDGVWFLLADPLVVIEADRNLKKKLWQALQKMFEVS